MGILAASPFHFLTSAANNSLERNSALPLRLADVAGFDLRFFVFMVWFGFDAQNGSSLRWATCVLRRLPLLVWLALELRPRLRVAYLTLLHEFRLLFAQLFLLYPMPSLCISAQGLAFGTLLVSLAFAHVCS